MKATGIVRRIDDLGRIVVPKEIRRTMRLREGDPMEIYTARDGVIMLKKYSPLHDMSGMAESYVKILFNSLNKAIVLCDHDQILAVAGLAKGDYEGKTISSFLEEKLALHHVVKVENPCTIELKLNTPIETTGYMLAPINVGGDVFGALLLLGIDESVSQEDFMVLQTVADILALQYM